MSDSSAACGALPLEVTLSSSQHTLMILSLPARIAIRWIPSAQAFLARFDGTYEGAVHSYLGCEIERNIAAGRTLLSQRHLEIISGRWPEMISRVSEMARDDFEVLRVA